MFMPPMERCPVEGCWVRLDRSQTECAAGHACGRPVHECPLAQYFTEQNGRDEGTSRVTTGPWRRARRKTGTEP